MVTAEPPSGGTEVDGSVTMSITGEGYCRVSDDPYGAAPTAVDPAALSLPPRPPLLVGCGRSRSPRRPPADGAPRRPGPTDRSRCPRVTPGRGAGHAPRASGRRWAPPPGRGHEGPGPE